MYPMKFDVKVYLAGFSFWILNGCFPAALTFALYFVAESDESDDLNDSQVCLCVFKIFGHKSLIYIRNHI